MRAAVTDQTWEQIRRAIYREYDYRCGICGATGRMTCHERWAYDDERQVQTLLGFIALCTPCHHVKHIGRAGILAREGRLDYDEVVQHFMAVNDCDESTFEEHRAQAFAVWQRRSTHPWTVDLGPWGAVVRENGKGVPL
jgi:hypothetical protein